MSAAIEDHTARVFAGAFYRAIGFGHSIDTALRLANAAIKIAGMQGQGASMLLGEGISAEQVVLLESGPEGTGEPDLELVSARPNGGQIDLLIRNRSNDSAIIYEITATVLQNDDRSILRTMESAATYTLPISGSPGTSHTISVSHLVEGHAGERFGIMPKSTESLVSSVALRYNDGEELIFYVRLRYGNLKAVGKTREELELAAMAKRSSPA
ncbi:MAG: hypothetical protein MJE77_38880 [Proteobacteria bacterium]|nr:hypothetical protein [Pseudomonadota bacterium]